MANGVWLGVDIGKSAHYAVAVDLTGATIYRAPVDNTEQALRTLIGWAQEHGAALVVDQPGGAAALLLRLCWDAQVPIAYLHGLAMARARDFYPGEAKTDPKDAFVLADVARAHPTRIVWLQATADARAQLELLCGYDADLRGDINRTSNRLRDLLATYWPALERALGARLTTTPVLTLLHVHPSGPSLRRSGVKRLTAALRRGHARHPETLAELIVTAARSQTVVIPGAETAARLIAELSQQLLVLAARRDQIEREIEQAFFALPEAQIILSLPGVGPRLGARIAVEIGDVSRFRTAAQLAAYAGLGPAPRQSGTSIHANTPSRFGNHRLKNAFFLAAFCSLRHEPSRRYYDRKRAEGRRHNQAVLCLARRRVDVLHAMLTRGTYYRVALSMDSSHAA